MDPFGGCLGLFDGFIRERDCVEVYVGCCDAAVALFCVEAPVLVVGVTDC